MNASFKLKRGIAIITIDAPPVNALGHTLRTALYERIGVALDDSRVRGMVLAGAGTRAFSAGADIAEFGAAASVAFPSLGELIERIERARVPVVAAIAGFALGGGLELALGCHARLVSTGASLGLPEIGLGLMPGAGGTQRLPRLIGRDAARALIAGGKPVRAEAALTAGIVDAVFDGDLVERAVDWLVERIKGGDVLPRTDERLLPASSDTPVSQPMRRSGAYVLPLDTIDRAIEAAGALPFEQGLALEQTLFSMLVDRPESVALRYAFLGERRTATLDDPTLRSASPRAIATVGVVGAGTMGAGIAICLASAKFPVLLFDSNAASLDRGIASIRHHFEQQAAKGRLAPDEAERCVARVKAATQADELAAVDLAIEAVFEDLAVKREVFAVLDKVLRPGAILATNTSTLDVDVIAGFTSRPRDVLGLHFFSPAPVMKLLEIVRGEATAPDVIVGAQALARRLGKVGVVSGVCDGFIGNRVWHQYLRQAARIVELGASPHQVDRALEQWGFAMGPFRVADLAGLDVGYAIRQRQQRDMPERRWPVWLDRVSETGRVGQKGGAAFIATTRAPVAARWTSMSTH
ncbi:3-hydroxyacyl-CoA dehydrogenase NAD-binding domain-containing protein [Burkholderia sp. 22PA0099]|uniref:3-hydroxyacyl-CoA dehydrogenase NAD-binding domain-containing protein n=1 Tax=Burkholderia sp. 22PA0099 TaxID=3237372 RepID=UPI0039C336CC